MSTIMCDDGQRARDTNLYYPNTTSANSIYIAPKFQQVEYNITTGDNVTVNGGKTTARGGESLTFTAVPPAGQDVTGWTVNGESVSGSGNTLVWTVENGCLHEADRNVLSCGSTVQRRRVQRNVQPAGKRQTGGFRRATNRFPAVLKVTFNAEPDGATRLTSGW